MPKPRVLLIGWDGADWSVLNQLMDSGRMPNLSRFIEQGVMGNLASLTPCLTPMLWTSVATGRTADQHGILGFVEPRSDGLGVIPSRSSTRRTKALWNIFDASCLKSCVVAWPVSDPVEPVAGVYVSERVTDGLATRRDTIPPVPTGCVHPSTLEPFLSELRLHPCELVPSDLAGMIPDIAHIDHSQDPRPQQLATIFARCATVHSIATATMEAEPWDFFAVYYETIDRAGHDFMSYRAPRMDHVSERDFHLYRNVIDGIYEFHDAMLGRLMQLAGEDTTIILLSDHGFQTGRLRPVHQTQSGVIPAEGAEWHRMLGVLAMKGPGIKRDERIYGASLLDIAPTVLTVFGLPVGRDMTGRVLTGAFTSSPEIRAIDSWETPAAPSMPEAPLDLDGREASVRQLAALGYLSADAMDGIHAARLAVREAQFNLGTVHLHHGRPSAALPLFEDLCTQAPLEPRYELSLLATLSRLGRQQEVLIGINRLETAGCASAQLDLLAASAYVATGCEAAALLRLQQAAAREPANAIVHQVTGDYYLDRGRLDDARHCYQQSIDIDHDNAPAHCGIAQVQLDLRDFEAAAEHALAALQVAFFNPTAQLRLGKAMEALGRHAEARRAYQHALEQTKSFREASLRLAALLLADSPRERQP